MSNATDYIFGEFYGVSKIELMKLMLDYLYEEMPLKFERNEDMMCWIQEKLMEEAKLMEQEEDNINMCCVCSQFGKVECEYDLCKSNYSSTTDNPLYKK